MAGFFKVFRDLRAGQVKFVPFATLQSS
ncbi:MAG: hypothetical protein JWM99_2524, partial [Verrucomicrobiales bacterium]|nr:hypothetical protein [Verrucomicrobiales bacterium]